MELENGGLYIAWGVAAMLTGSGANIFSDPKQGVPSICGLTSLSTVAVDASFGCWFVGRGTKTLDQYSKGDLSPVFWGNFAGRKQVGTQNCSCFYFLYLLRSLKAKC